MTLDVMPHIPTRTDAVGITDGPLLRSVLEDGRVSGVLGAGPRRGGHLSRRTSCERCGRSPLLGTEVRPDMTCRRSEIQEFE